MEQQKVKSVTECLNDIIQHTIKQSGYPYTTDSEITDNMALAYGLAIGHMMSLKIEWERNFERKA